MAGSQAKPITPSKRILEWKGGGSTRPFRQTCTSEKKRVLVAPTECLRPWNQPLADLSREMQSAWVFLAPGKNKKTHISSKDKLHRLELLSVPALVRVHSQGLLLVGLSSAHETAWGFSQTEEAVRRTKHRTQVSPQAEL